MKRLQLLFISILLFISAGFSQSDFEKAITQKVKVIGHAHMDPVYRWKWNEMENREIYNTFSNVLNTIDKYPQLHFAQSFLLYYSTIQMHFPALFEEVKKSIKNKRWSVVGGQWVEPDETLPSGESLIRQFLVANDYYSKNLGIENINIAWSPDVFTGHPVTLPKIYVGCGIKNYVFSREAPEGKNIFWWESKDGSKMLAYKIPGSYNPDFKGLPDLLKAWTKTADYYLPMITFGKGDHGGGPDVSDLRTLELLEKETPLRFEHVSPEDYFKELNNSGKNWPVQNEEIGYNRSNSGGFGGSGCYTSQAKIKKLNRYYENQLIAAEKFSALGTMHKGKPFYPREDFLQAWKILLFNQFHDIIPGTLTRLAINDVYKDYEKLGQIISEQLNEGIDCIGNRINTMTNGIPLVVYNPHSWTVNQFVDAELKFVKKPVGFSLKDPSGKDVPFSVVEKSVDELLFKIFIDAHDIPPLGFKVFDVIEKKPEKRNTDLKINNNQIENSYYLIKWDKTGIISIFSKKLQKEILKDYTNQLQLLEDNGSSWGLNLTGKEFIINQLTPAKVIFSSPLKVVVKWEDYFETSIFSRYMIVKTNSDQIEFEMEVDWHSHNKLLRLVFPTNITNGEAYFDQPYGYVKRNESQREAPAQNWIDYSNSSYGVSLINNGKYGFSINKGILTMSVVRGARDMDPRMDEGKHSFKYSLIVHEGDWREADIPLKAWEINQPLIAKQEDLHPGEISGWAHSGESFPLEKSFFSIKSDHVIISSLKFKQDAYDSNQIILRIVETEGRDDDVVVQLPYNTIKVTECNHLEQQIELRSEIKVSEKQFRFNMGHDQIRTFMILF
jgi:alpha-mannosidase